MQLHWKCKGIVGKTAVFSIAAMRELTLAVTSLATNSMNLPKFAQLKFLYNEFEKHCGRMFSKLARTFFSSMPKKHWSGFTCAYIRGAFLCQSEITGLTDSMIVMADILTMCWHKSTIKVKLQLSWVPDSTDSQWFITKYLRYGSMCISLLLIRGNFTWALSTSPDEYMLSVGGFSAFKMLLGLGCLSVFCHRHTAQVSLVQLSRQHAAFWN